MKPNDALLKLAVRHRRWLSMFSPQYLANWDKMHNADYEAAMTEARIREFLQRKRILVEPNEKLTGDCGGPDFQCLAKGKLFYVEVANISIDNATEGFGLKPNESGPCNPAWMAEAIWAKCKGKAVQCGGLDAPTLIAVGTFHSEAAVSGFRKKELANVLVGKTALGFDVNLAAPGPIDEFHQIASLEKSAFLRPDPASEVDFLRSSISGVLCCAVGIYPMKVRGVLHPASVRPFDCACLPKILFAHVKIDRVSKQLFVEWK